MKNIGKELNYRQACAFLKSARSLGSRPGLENISILCRLLGDPQNLIKTIHIAGTNGKGSVSAMTASILQAAGFKTGLYLSPHLGEYPDAMRINGQIANNEDFAQSVSFVRNKAREMTEMGLCPTEFELLTATAFLWFYERGCDFAVVETGMGGRLDATNVIVKPMITILTPIAKDHTALLGDTIERITAEKCGIIKPDGITVVSPLQEDAAMGVIQNTVSEKNNILVIPDSSQAGCQNAALTGSDCVYKNMSFHLPLIGRHQLYNAVTAIEAARVLNRHYGYAITEEHIKNGIKQVRLNARQELLRQKPLVLLDGAHNLQGIEALCRTIDDNLKGKKTAVVMGMLRDKDYNACIAQIAQRAGLFIAVQPPNERALPAEEAASAAKNFCSRISVRDDYAQALKDAISFAEEDGAVVICGSLYMAAGMREAALSWQGR